MRQVREDDRWSGVLLVCLAGLAVAVGSYLSVQYFLAEDFGMVAVPVMAATGVLWVVLAVSILTHLLRK